MEWYDYLFVAVFACAMLAICLLGIGLIKGSKPKR